MPKNSSPISVAFDAGRSSSSLPPQLQRKIAARWKEWEPWVWLYLRHGGSVPGGSPELARLRRRNSEHLLALIWAGIRMRVVRRHRLDDPRITDDVRAVLVRAAIQRRRKAWLARHRGLNNPPTSSVSELGNSSSLGAATLSDSLLLPESSQIPPQGLGKMIAPQERRVTMDLVQERVGEVFNLRELGDQSLKVRSNRLAIAFPRQVAMYIVRQLTTASLQEIGRQFGGRHHTTVLHSINRIAEMRRSDKALDRTIKQLMHGVLV